ncbi:hypothetical protein ABFS83_01G031300 [Erythranthe nasuta]
MEVVGDDNVVVVVRTSLKRKSPEITTEDEISRFPLNELNQDLLERVLSWLPTSSFLRLSSVCKRWKSTADSATFRRACSQVPAREPWFFMVDSRKPQSSIAFDSSEGNLKKLNRPPLFSAVDFIPVASSGGLICFHSNTAAGDFIVTNPVTGACHQLTSLPTPHPPILAISMTSSKAGTFKVFVVSGELPNITFRQYTSGADQWEEEISLTRKSATKNISSPIESEANDDDCTQYFLSKCGNVISPEIQRSPSKQYSSVLTISRAAGDEILHFLSSSGTVVACNLTRRLFSEYPRLLPVFSEYSIDLVECAGEMYVVLLCDFLESCSVRVWSWDEKIQSWRQVAAMPPHMSHKFYSKKADINCSGGGGKMFVCVSSGEMCCYVMCDLVGNEWIEVPQFYDNGDEAKEFASALSFEPRIEASVN